MHASHYLSCLWPGLAELWWRGRLSAIPTAVIFALAINGWLVTRFIYPGWMSAGLVTMGFWIGVCVWAFYTVRAVRELPSLITPRSVSDAPDRFAEAHTAYLRGDWEQAEDLLTDVLAIEPRDPPALLMLTAVYRHTGRLSEAGLLLSEIGRLEVADAWWLEVAAETRRLDQARAAAEPAAEDAAETPAEDAAEAPAKDAADLTGEPQQAA